MNIKLFEKLVKGKFRWQIAPLTTTYYRRHPRWLEINNAEQAKTIISSAKYFRALSATVFLKNQVELEQWNCRSYVRTFLFLPLYTIANAPCPMISCLVNSYSPTWITSIFTSFPLTTDIFTVSIYLQSKCNKRSIIFD